MKRSNKPSISTRPRIFYGWWIVLGGMLGTFLSAGFNWHGLNAFVIPVSTTYGVSLAAVTTMLAVAQLESAFIGPLEGYLVDRFGPRVMMFIGVPLMGGGFLLVSMASSFAGFVAILFIGVILGNSIGFSTPIVAAVANWWHRSRGRAFGIMWLGLSAGGVIVPLINQSIERFGWRSTVRVMGMLVFVIGLPVAAIMRHKPEQYGMLPDGDDPAREGGQSANLSDDKLPTHGVPDAQQVRGLTLKEALKTRSFWYFAMSFGIRMAVTSAVAINLFPLVLSLGGTATQASFLFLVHGLSSAPGRLFLSWAGDYLNKKYIMAALLLVLGGTVYLIGQAGSYTQIAYIYVPFAFAWGGLSALPNSLQADLFGRRNYATIRGALAPLQSALALVAPPFATVMFERTGSYSFPFTVLAGVALIAMVLILKVKPQVVRVEVAVV
jgi:MFS family permease